MSFGSTLDCSCHNVLQLTQRNCTDQRHGICTSEDQAKQGVAAAQAHGVARHEQALIQGDAGMGCSPRAWWC